MECVKLTTACPLRRRRDDAAHASDAQGPTPPLPQLPHPMLALPPPGNRNMGPLWPGMTRLSPLKSLSLESSPELIVLNIAATALAWGHHPFNLKSANAKKAIAQNCEPRSRQGSTPK